MVEEEKKVVKEQDKNENYKLSLIFYLDDDESRKDKTAYVFQDTNGIWIKYVLEMEPFFLPYHRVLKIKPAKKEGEEDGRR